MSSNRKCFAIGLIAMASTAMADDIIVLRNGDLINAKVEEISESTIKYHKATNPTGPIYSIATDKVLSINFENGEKEVFDSPTAPAAQSTPTTIYQQNKAVAEEANRAAVDKFNSTPLPQYQRTDNNKDANRLLAIFGLTPNSVIEDDVIAISFRHGGRETTNSGGRTSGYAAFVPTSDQSIDAGDWIELTVENKSDQIIFIDLGNSFVNRNGEASPFYVPKATSQGMGTSSGVGLNLGTITPALSGVSVGGGASTTSGTTTFTQRVLAIPPHSKRALEAQNVFFDHNYITCWDDIVSQYRGFVNNHNGEGWRMQGGYKRLPAINLGKKHNFKRGMSMSFSPEDNRFNVGHTIAYSFSEDCSDLTTLSSTLYLKALMGYHLSIESTRWKPLAKMFSGYGDATCVTFGLEDDNNNPIFPRP